MRTKLVRDHCSAVIEGECRQALTDAEYQMALLLKLHEEAQEIAGAVHDPEEYADLLEVLIALANHNNVTGEDILSAFVMKRERRGGFEEGQIWREVQCNPLDSDMQFDFDFYLPPPVQVFPKIRALPEWLHTTFIP